VTGRDTKLLDQLFGFSTVWNLAHRQLICSDALLSKSPENGVTEPSVRIVVFDSNNDTARSPRRSNQLVAIDWLHTGQINDADRNALFFELIVRCQSFKHGDATRDHECRVLVASSEEDDRAPFPARFF
jgi:hypothetical protein